MASRPVGMLGLLAGAMALAGCGPAPVDDSHQGLICPQCVPLDDYYEADGVLVRIPRDAPEDASLYAVVDMGEVAVGDEVTRKITLVNSSRSSDIIVANFGDVSPFSVDLGCGAHSTRCDIAGGAHLDIGFTFHATYPGAEEKMLSFATWSGRGPFYVHLKAIGVAPHVTCLPASNLEFGTFIQGESHTDTITCQNVTDLPMVLVVDPILDDTHQFSASSGELHIGPHASVDIQVTFAAGSLAAGVAQSEAYAPLAMHESRGDHSFTILMEANVLASALEIDPTPGDLGFIRPGTSSHRVLTLQNLGHKPLTITALALDDSSDREFALQLPAATPFPIRAGGDVQIGLTFAPPAGDVGKRTGRIDVYSDDPGGAVRFYDLAAFVGGPEVSCTWEGVPRALDFGEAVMGSISTREITCSNVSTFDDPTTDADNLRVLALHMNDDPSSYQASIYGDPLGRGYEAGQVFTIAVQYSPQSIETHDDIVILRTNDPDHPELDIPVTGVGVQ